MEKVKVMSNEKFINIRKCKILWIYIYIYTCWSFVKIYIMLNKKGVHLPSKWQVVKYVVLLLLIMFSLFLPIYMLN